MKKNRLIFVLLSIIITPFTAYISSAIDDNNFKIILEPKWENLENDQDRIAHFGGKWILAGSITFKKKIKDYIRLSQITLQWFGPHLEKLTGSLYEKNFERTFYPIQDFFISDGIWNKKTQTLTFPFDRHCWLQAVNTFFLVLTIPVDQEESVKTGSFSIADMNLPEEFKQSINTQKLSLSFNTLQHKA